MTQRLYRLRRQWTCENEQARKQKNGSGNVSHLSVLLPSNGVMAHEFDNHAEPARCRSLRRPFFRSPPCHSSCPPTRPFPIFRIDRNRGEGTDYQLNNRRRLPVRIANMDSGIEVPPAPGWWNWFTYALFHPGPEEEANAEGQIPHDKSGRVPRWSKKVARGR